MPALGAEQFSRAGVRSEEDPEPHIERAAPGGYHGLL